MGLKRQNRVPGAAGIQALRQHGKPTRHRMAVALVLPTQQPVSRFAISASARVGNAVTRNRAKRRFREAIRQLLPHISPGYDCLIILRKPASAAHFDDIASALWHLLTHAGILQPNTLSQPPIFPNEKHCSPPD